MNLTLIAVAALTAQAVSGAVVKRDGSCSVKADNNTLSSIVAPTQVVATAGAQNSTTQVVFVTQTYYTTVPPPTELTPTVHVTKTQYTTLQPPSNATAVVAAPSDYSGIPTAPPAPLGTAPGANYPFQNSTYSAIGAPYTTIDVSGSSSAAPPAANATTAPAQNEAVQSGTIPGFSWPTAPAAPTAPSSAPAPPPSNPSTGAPPASTPQFTLKNPPTNTMPTSTQLVFVPVTTTTQAKRNVVESVPTAAPNTNAINDDANAESIERRAPQPSSSDAPNSLFTPKPNPKPTSTPHATTTPKPTSKPATPTKPANSGEIVNTVVMSADPRCPYPYPGIHCGKPTTTLTTETKKATQTEAKEAKKTGWCAYPYPGGHGKEC